MNPQAKILLANNEELIVNEKTEIVILLKTHRVKNDHDDITESSFQYTTAVRYPLRPTHHHHDGFIPSLTEMFSNGDFFSITGDTSQKVYSVSSIVSISNFSD